VAHQILTLENRSSKRIREAPMGASWTCMFFAFFVPLVRQHYTGFIVWLILIVISLGSAVLLMMIFYNTHYLRYLTNKKGYKIVGSEADIIFTHLRPLVGPVTSPQTQAIQKKIATQKKSLADIIKMILGESLFLIWAGVDKSKRSTKSINRSKVLTSKIKRDRVNRD